jgi:uncharacterized membrane protein YkvA (DUF1232 family)
MDYFPMKSIEKLKQKAVRLKQELAAIYLACRDPRTPWYAKALGICVVGYALSPIDLIPDPIPVLGYLDDLILIPLGIVAVRKMIPSAVLAECREKAKELTQSKKKNWISAGIIVAIWIIAAIWIIRWLGYF